MMKVRNVALAAAVVVAAAASSAVPKVSAELSWNDRPECSGEPGAEECPSGSWCNDGRCVCDDSHIECESFGDPPALQCVHLELVQDGYCDCEEQCTDENDRDGDGGPIDGDGGDGGDGWGTNPGDGSSSGDPHFRSLDGLYFDFQGLGEFTYAENQGGLTINTCQQPWVHNPTGATVNHAVTVNFEGNTVAIQYADGGYQLYVNGEVSTQRGEFAAGNLSVNAGSAGILVSSTAGDRVTLTANDWAQWIDINYAPGSASRGLAGTNNGNVNDDFTHRDGSVTSLYNAPWYFLNQAAKDFGESWRATTSLLPAAVSCPTTAAGFTEFDILQDVFNGDGPDRDGPPLPQAAAAAPTPRTLAELKAMMGQSSGKRRTTAASIVIEEHIEDVMSCLAQGLGISVDELTYRMFMGDNRSVRYWQCAYDLMFFTYGNGSGNPPLSTATCAGGHRILEALIPEELVAAPDTEVVTAFCDGNGNSCSTASASSGSKRISLQWNEQADSEC